MGVKMTTNHSEKYIIMTDRGGYIYYLKMTSSCESIDRVVHWNTNRSSALSFVNRSRAEYIIDKLKLTKCEAMLKVTR